MINSAEIKNFAYKIGEDIKDVLSVRKNVKNMGVSGAAAFSLDKIIEVVIALVIMGTILPLGIKEFMAAGNSGVLAEGTIHAVWVIAPVLIVLGLVLGLIYMALGKNNG